MSRQQSAQLVEAGVVAVPAESNTAEQPFDFRGPWFDTLTAAAYIPCLDRRTRRPSRRAFYEWRRRHGIIARRNGSVAKADLDRVLNRHRRAGAGGRGHHVNSLRNLRKRSA